MLFQIRQRIIYVNKSVSIDHTHHFFFTGSDAQRIVIEKMAKKGMEEASAKGSSINKRPVGRPPRSDFVTCPHCEKRFKKMVHKIHYQKCLSTKGSKRDRPIKIHERACLRLKEEVLSTLSKDHVTEEVANDELAVMLFNKFCQDLESTKTLKNKIRLLSRALLSMRSIDKSVTDLASIFTKKHIDTLYEIRNVSLLNAVIPCLYVCGDILIEKYSKEHKTHKETEVSEFIEQLKRRRRRGRPSESQDNVDGAPANSTITSTSSELIDKVPTPVKKSDIASVKNAEVVAPVKTVGPAPVKRAEPAAVKRVEPAPVKKAEADEGVSGNASISTTVSGPVPTFSKIKDLVDEYKSIYNPKEEDLCPKSLETLEKALYCAATTDKITKIIQNDDLIILCGISYCDKSATILQDIEKMRNNLRILGRVFLEMRKSDLKVLRDIKSLFSERHIATFNKLKREKHFIQARPLLKRVGNILKNKYAKEGNLVRIADVERFMEILEKEKMKKEDSKVLKKRKRYNEEKSKEKNMAFLELLTKKTTAVTNVTTFSNNKESKLPMMETPAFIKQEPGCVSGSSDSPLFPRKIKREHVESTLSIRNHFLNEEGRRIYDIEDEENMDNEIITDGCLNDGDYEEETDDREDRDVWDIVHNSVSSQCQ